MTFDNRKNDFFLPSIILLLSYLTMGIILIKDKQIKQCSEWNK